MNWENEEPCINLDTNDSVRLLALGWEGRLVWYEILRKCYPSGAIHHEGNTDFVADFLRVPPEIFKVGYERLIAGGLVVDEQGVLRVPDYQHFLELRGHE